MEHSDMRTALSQIEAISLDFYNTLIFHREGPGRGHALIEYLETHGFEHAPWEHGVLYDVFEDHDTRYSPAGSPEERQAYYAYLAGRVFERLGVPSSNGDASRHAAELWRILGPDCFDLFPDALPTLAALRAQGYPIVIVSNWQAGLRHFCTELGLSGYVDHVVGSADFGVAKPERAIFHEACDRLGLPPEQVVHVGDTPVDDYEGGRAAGLRVILLQRETGASADVEAVIHGLDELPNRLAAAL